MNRRQFGRAAASRRSGFTPSLAQGRQIRRAAPERRFNWNPPRSPDGPVLVIVSIPDQLVYVYRNGVRIAASTCSTGKLGHRTPTGVFKILQGQEPPFLDL